MNIKVAALIIVLFTVTACASTPKVSAPDINQMSPTMSEVVLGPGDVIDIKFRFLPELDYQQAIRPDGKISLQMVDEVVAAGMTPDALDKHLTELYSQKLKSPEITVVVVSLANQFVYVGGEVEEPGVLPLVGSLSATQAVLNSGGLKDSAQPENAIIVRKGADNQPIPVAFNMQSVLDGNSDVSDFMLRPSDIVYIPKSPIAKANLFVRQYIQDLFLFRGVGMGFSYELHADD